MGAQESRNLVSVLFLQSDSIWCKVSSMCLKFTIVTQLALQTHQNFQCYLHKTEEVFVSLVLCE